VGFPAHFTNARAKRHPRTIARFDDRRSGRHRGNYCACVAFRNAPNLSPAPRTSARYTLAAASAATARLTKTFPPSFPRALAPIIAPPAFARASRAGSVKLELGGGAAPAGRNAGLPGDPAGVPPRDAAAAADADAPRPRGLSSTGTISPR